MTSPVSSAYIDVNITFTGISLAGLLVVPEHAKGLVVFAHGSGSSRFSQRNRFVAKILNKAGVATLLFDLLTLEEEDIDLRTREFRFDIDLLADRSIDRRD
jgi:putative phosphoribosyl transferase